MIKTTKDGRTIRSGRDYTEFRIEVFQQQSHLCSECGAFCSLDIDIESDYSFHVDHLNGRGMGGGKRDDTFAAVRGKCGKCHRRKHNQQ